MTKLESISEHIFRVILCPHNLADGTRQQSWECMIDLRFDPPHHFAKGYGATEEEAIEQAVAHAKTHIAIARAQ